MSEATEHVVLHGAETATLTPDEWQARVDELTTLLTETGLTPEEITEDLRVAFGGITFRDSEHRSWRHDAVQWWRWDDASGWEAQPPPALLLLDTVEFELAPEIEEVTPETVALTLLPFRSTHTVPGAGLPAWVAPDPTTSAVASLDPGLEIELLEQRDDGWANIRCSNDWTAWVDGRLLIPC